MVTKPNYLLNTIAHFLGWFMDRIKMLEYAKKLAIIAGKYNESLGIIDEILDQNHSDIDALRLKGNVLDLRQLYMEQNECERSILSETEGSKIYYEKIIRIDPENTLAYIDLGDYWERKDNHNLALEFYDKAIENLQTGKFYKSHEDECEEVFYRKSELLAEINKISESLKCVDIGLSLCKGSNLLKALKDRIQGEKKGS